MSTSSVSSSRLRISGYSSGLDVDSIVQQLMKVESAKVDKVKQDKQLLEWKRDDYRNITSLLRALKDKYFNTTSSSNLLSSTSFNKTSISVSNPLVAQVTGSTTGVAAHTLDIIKTAKVGAANSAAQADGFDPATKTVSDFTGVTTLGDPVLKIGTKTFELRENETINQFMTRVNSSSENNAYRLSFDASGNRFVITTKSTGENLVSASGAFIDAADFTGFKDKNDEFVVSGGVLTVTGEKAEFTLDGITGYTSNTNSFTADGLTYNFLQPGTANVSTSRDVEGIISNIKSFVEDYNNIISTINTETSEKRYRDYAPLTDEQKSAMSESDIKLWEGKAKSGLLNGDSLLTRLGDRLKTATYDAINLSPTTTTALASIGISTTSRYDKGKLTVDENKLRTALTESPEKVIAIFTNESDKKYNPNATAADRAERYQENGVLFKLSDVLNDYTRTTMDSSGEKGLLIEKAGFTNESSDYDNYMQDLITDKDDLISVLTDRLNAKEEAYYKKFTAMETALNKMNSQSSWISQQLSS